MPGNSPSGPQVADADDKPSGTDDESSGADTDAEADAVPLDLPEHYRMKASDFDKNKRYPWPAAPRGQFAPAAPIAPSKNGWRTKYLEHSFR
jgi:hypothetical protein